MSSTAQLVLLAERPEYTARTVRASYLLAAPVEFKHTKGFMFAYNYLSSRLFPQIKVRSR